MIDIPGAVSAITAALGLARELRQIDVNVEKAELKLKVATITDALADAKVALTEAGLRISELESAASLKSDLSQKIAKLLKNGELFYNGQVTINSATCPHCVEVDQRIVSLHAEPFDSTILSCSRCKNSYANPFFKFPPGSATVETDFDVFRT